MATSTVSVQKKVISFVPTDVLLEALEGTEWQLTEGVMLVLLRSDDKSAIGWINSEKEMHVYGKNTPPAVNMNKATDSIRDAYQAMKTAGAW